MTGRAVYLQFKGQGPIGSSFTVSQPGINNTNID